MSLRELSYAEAIREALAIALDSDERVFLMGEDIGVYGGAFQVTGDLIERFGEERVMDTPISELGGAGVAVGAALTGMRPVYEFQFSDFSMLAMEQIVNQAAKLRYMLGGAVHVPVVFRMPTGSGLGGAAQHSQSIEAWYAHVPGLKVVEPATPEDVKGMLLAAIRDPDPVIVFEHKLLYKMKGAVPEGPYETPLDKAAVRREGSDLTIVATGIMVHRALEAAAILASDDIDAEVIDLRSLRPIDKPAIIASVRKTARLLAVYEGVKTLGIGAEISAIVAESEAFDYLEAPILRLGGAEAPIPYSPVLEKAAVPQVEDIVAAARRLARFEVAREFDLAHEIVMPRVDMDMTSGRMGRWHAAEGARVVKGETLFEIETDKAAMEIDAPASGVLRFVAAAEGDVLPVGACIGWIVADGEEFLAPEANVGATAAPRPSVLASAAAKDAAYANAAFGLRATPAARRAARERGLRLSDARGTGPGGRIQLRDLEEPRAAAPVRDGPSRVVQARGGRADRVHSRVLRRPQRLAPALPSPARDAGGAGDRPSRPWAFALGRGSEFRDAGRGGARGADRRGRG